MTFSQAQDRSPVFEDAGVDSDLGFGVDVDVAFVFFLPGGGGGESGVGFFAPLHGCSGVVAGFLLDFLFSDEVEFFVVGVALHHAGIC